ncbi:alpha/beta hydrolase [Spirochaetia bacterium]|nr:alpha/beta hydrolase [Spirochaetia bacterium]
MIDTITPWTNADSPMKPWPALAPLARLLHICGDKETIFYYDTGAAAGGDTNAVPQKPAIVLIHGLGDEADSWRNLIPLLQSKYRVLAPDLPGFGRSAAPGRINIKRHIAAVITLMETAGCASPSCPVVLAGSSMGTGIAEGAAIARPDLVRGIILLDGCVPSSIKLNAGFFFLALPFLGKGWYRKFRKDHEAAYQSLFGYYAGIENMTGEDRQFLRERVIARVESDTQERAYFGSLRSLVWTYQSAARRFSRGIAAYARGEMAQGTTPGKMLILWGEKDRVLSPDSAKTIRELCPGTGFAIIPGAGHLPHQEKAAETATSILRFMTEF